MSRNTLRLYLAMAVLFGVSVFGGVMYSIRNSAPSVSVMNPEALRLGRVQVQEPVRRTIRLVNSGRRIAEIGDIRASCGCTSISRKAFDIDPGQSDEVELTFDFTSVTNRDNIPLDRPFSVMLAAITKPPHRHVFQWHISGTIESVFRRVPQFVEFTGGSPRSTPISGEFTVEFHQALDEVQVTSTEPAVRIRVVPDADRKVFGVGCVAPFADYGEKTVGLEIAPVSRGKAHAPIRTDLMLRRVPDVRPEPPFINLGVIAREQIATTRLRLASESAEAFEIASVSAASDENSASDGTAKHAVRVVPREDESEFAVEIASASTGSHTGTIVFAIRQSGDAYEVKVPLNYHVTDSPGLVSQELTATKPE